jgi:hypothetical protein
MVDLSIKGINSMIKIKLKEVPISDIYQKVSESFKFERERNIIIGYLPQLKINWICLHEYSIFVNFLKMIGCWSVYMIWVFIHHL